MAGRPIPGGQFAMVCGDTILDDDEECDEVAEDCVDCVVQAIPIAGTGMYGGGFAPTSFDRFEITVDGPRNVSLHVIDDQGGCPGDTLFTLTGPVLGTLMSDDQNDDNLCPRLDVYLQPGVYELQVSGRAEQYISYTLDVVFGDVCPIGEVGCPNPCEEDNGGCPLDATCSIVEQAVQCRCARGYKLADLACADIDECADENGGCAQDCVNTDGGFLCSCRDGYSLNDDGAACDDIDECAQNNGDCAQECVNNDGGFRCACRPGQTLDDDNRNCRDLNECDVENGGCSQICINIDDGFECAAAMDLFSMRITEPVMT